MEEDEFREELIEELKEIRKNLDNIEMRLFDLQNEG